jgi:hypothetical protein
MPGEAYHVKNLLGARYYQLLLNRVINGSLTANEQSELTVMQAQGRGDCFDRDVVTVTQLHAWRLEGGTTNKTLSNNLLIDPANYNGHLRQRSLYGWPRIREESPFPPPS